MDIPRFPDVRELTLDDRALLEAQFSRIAPCISELTFANLYLFRRAHAYRITRVENTPVVFGTGYGGEPYFLPPFDTFPCPAARFLLKLGMTLYGADERLLVRLREHDCYAAVEDRDNFDYLYLREELAALPGGKFHKKKNRINYLLKRVEVSVAEFSAAHIEGALRLLEEWRSVKMHETNGSLELEVEAAAEALRRHRELGLEGVVCIIEGEIKAFALGERLNAETAVCHFEKADPFTDGLSQLINREFSKRIFIDCRYVNREQDLGDPGLRNAKLSYHPVELVKKYRVTFIPR